MGGCLLEPQLALVANQVFARGKDKAVCARPFHELLPLYSREEITVE